MNEFLRNRVAALFLLLPGATAMIALPSAAMAQAAALELHSLQISSDGGLSAGAQLGFTIQGTTRGQAHIRIEGINRDIALKETSRGVYSGSYTIMRQDAVSQTSPIQAVLQEGGRNTVLNYSFPSGMATVPTADLGQPDKLKIERFTVVPIKKVEPGAELRFSMNGMPGGNADVEIPGVIAHVPLREARPGVYEGSYTIRRQDNLTSSRPIVATLWQGEKFVRASLTKPWVDDAQAPVIRNLSPREGASVSGTGVAVSGTFDDADGAGVDPKSVRILLAGRNVTDDSKVTAQRFTYRTDLQPGRHTVDVTAKDLTGNAVRKTWSFSVGGKASGHSSATAPCEPPASTKAKSPAVKPVTSTSAKSSAAKPVTSTSAKSSAAKPATSTSAKSSAAKPVTSTPAKSSAAKPATSTSAKSSAAKPATSTSAKSPAAKPATSTSVKSSAAKPATPTSVKSSAAKPATSTAAKSATAVRSSASATSRTSGAAG